MGKFQTCCTFLVYTWSFLIFVGFWMGIVFGYAYFTFIDTTERSWDCYAVQDKSVLEPWNGEGPVPDNLHHVNANFDVCLYWGFVNYLLVVLLFLIARECVHKEKQFFAAICCLILFVSAAIHTITVGVMRFRHAGKVCSGDYSDSIQTWALLGTQKPYLH